MEFTREPGAEPASRAAAGRDRSQRINTWELVVAQLERVRGRESEEERIDLLVELLVNLRLIGKDPCIPDLRLKKADIESTYAEVERATRGMLEAARRPSARFIYYAREVLKKLPVRQGAEDMIEQIRMAAEAFEEDRVEDDPMRGFAGDLRKEVHRRLSPRIIDAYLDPYLALVLRGDGEPLARAGYVALPSLFSAGDEDESLIGLAVELRERLGYLWDYESGNLASIKAELEANLALFERCFLRAEVEGFLGLLTPGNLGDSLSELDLLKRLASFKHFLKESYGESRIGLYDFLLLDLSLGRLVFLLANDLTNNHFAEVAPHNAREALGVLRELLNISSIKGLAIGDVEGLQAELDALRAASAFDYVQAKRCLSSICAELQRYLQAEIIDKMSGTLNRALEGYEVPTSRLSSIKTRFFNNFIRRTQVHVLSEFAEKTAQAVELELQRQNAYRQLYSDLRPAPSRGGPGEGKPGGASPVEAPPPRDCFAATWLPLDERLRPFLGGKGNSLIDMARLGLRVPPAFVLGFPLFADLGPGGEPGGYLESLLDRLLAELEGRTGRALGDPERPLIVSVRSGAAVSMPGVMVTILNAGFTPEVRAAVEARRGPEPARSLYRRFLENCRTALSLAGIEGGAGGEAGMDSGALEALLAAALGERFLTDARYQLAQCVALVNASGRSPAVHAFSRTLATEVRSETAVTVQRMVYGNLNERSLSGVVITRNPITGKDELFGEFKRRAQGEEVVMGSAGAEPISVLEPGLVEGLEACKRILVERYRQDLDIEFTVEDGELYFLQARAAKLGAFASLVADTDFLDRGIIGPEAYRERLDRLEAAHSCVALPRADFPSRSWNPPLALGVPINGGVVSGTLVLSEERLEEARRRRESVVYFAYSTKPTDFAVIDGAAAIVTIYPGRTSHAAITAMSMNKTCIVGCSNAEIDLEGRSVAFSGAVTETIREGERVTADGNTGAIYRGVAPISEFFLPISEVKAALAGTPASASTTVQVVRDLVAERLARVRRETNRRRMSLDEAGPLDGRRVLVRVDANADLRELGAAGVDRILQLVPTLRALLDRGATPVACSHLGDPGASPDSKLSREEIYEAFSLGPAARILGKALEGRFVFHELSVASSGLLLGPGDIVPGAVNLIENLRFATGEKDNDDAFARSLAELCDGWFVNDAFNVCNRRHASITGVPAFVEHSLAGPVVARELAILEELLGDPPRPFVAVFGGEEIAAQFGVMSALLPRVDRLVLLAPSPAGDHEPGGIEGDRGPEAVLPMIAALRAAFPQKVAAVLPDGRGDGGEEGLERAGTILWSGPAGLLGDGGRRPMPHGGSCEAAFRRAIRRGAFAVLCSKSERHFADARSPRLHISSGPGAFLEYLERLSLPGITALDPSPENAGPDAR